LGNLGKQFPFLGFNMVKAYLEPDEIEKLEMSAGNLRDRLLVSVLFHLGCRVSEALGLEVEHLDFVQNTVTIQHLKARIKLACPECGARLGKRHAFCPGCGVKVQAALAKELEHRRMRTLPLDKGTLAMLQEYVRRGGPVEKNG
jgi:integrase/recombinase XerD